MAGGISMYRVSIPIALIGFFVSLFCFGIQEYLLPYTNRRASECVTRSKTDRSKRTTCSTGRWMLGQDERIYNYAYYDAQERLFNGLAVYEFDPNRFSLTQRFYAQTAAWDPPSASWTMQDGWLRHFNGQAGIERFDELGMHAMEPPDYFTKERRQSSQMTYLELAEYIDELSQGGIRCGALEGGPVQQGLVSVGGARDLAYWSPIFFHARQEGSPLRDRNRDCGGPDLLYHDARVRLHGGLGYPSSPHGGLGSERTLRRRRPVCALRGEDLSTTVRVLKKSTAPCARSRQLSRSRLSAKGRRWGWGPPPH